MTSNDLPRWPQAAATSTAAALHKGRNERSRRELSTITGQFTQAPMAERR
jgi:hypothetical protein